MMCLCLATAVFAAVSGVLFNGNGMRCGPLWGLVGWRACMVFKILSTISDGLGSWAEVTATLAVLFLLNVLATFEVSYGPIVLRC